METAIIVASIQALGTIIVAVITLLTNRKVQKIDDIKSEIREDIEINKQQDILRHNETMAKLNELEVIVDENDIGAVRSRIVAFDNLCRLDINNNQIRQHQYDTIFKDIDKWAMYHEKYPNLNGEIDVAIENIKEHYKNATNL